jgi:hypothetical protein
MLPIAAHIAVRLTREQAQSALPNAPVRPDPPERDARATSARSLRMLVTVLRRLAATSGGLADRIERLVGGAPATRA